MAFKPSNICLKYKNLSDGSKKENPQILKSMSVVSLENVFICNSPAWKVSKYRVFSGPNIGKYGPEKTPYLDTFHGVFRNVIFT